MSPSQSDIFKLPEPFLSGGLSLVEAMRMRRSIRIFKPEPILLYQLSQILWAAQGISNSHRNLRTAPSAGGTYPLEIYALIGDDGIQQISPGVYRYEPADHILSSIIHEDIRWKLAIAALNQESIAQAPVCLIISAISERTLMRYSLRGERYIYMEAGHTAQNIYLQATALGLGTVAIGAFRDSEVRKLLKMHEGEIPLYLMPLGKPERL